MFVRGHTFSRKRLYFKCDFQIKSLVTSAHGKTDGFNKVLYLGLWCRLGLKVTDEGETDEGSEEELDVFFF